MQSSCRSFRSRWDDGVRHGPRQGKIILNTLFQKDSKLRSCSFFPLTCSHLNQFFCVYTPSILGIKAVRPFLQVPCECIYTINVFTLSYVINKAVAFLVLCGTAWTPFLSCTQLILSPSACTLSYTPSLFNFETGLH